MENKAKYTLEFEKPLEVLEEQLNQLKAASNSSSVVNTEVKAIEKQIDTIKKEVYSNLSAWQRIQLARHPERPYALDYIERIFEDFQELHGDRLFGDDGAIVGGTALFNKQPVMVIGQQKGRTTREKLKRNFGSPNPEGYRKALRLMKMAQNFSLPIVSLIDTAGAYPGVGAEERHVAEAIAVNIREMSTFTVPIIAAIIGEGGSGGALGVGLADSVIILQNAYYSVISPEGCAAILWKDRSYAPQAAEALKITADELLSLGVIDEIVPEPLGGAHRDAQAAAQFLKDSINNHLSRLKKLSNNDLLSNRYQKYRNMGVFNE